MTRFLKTLHGWLGVLIFPWIVLAGATGIYENHGFDVMRILPWQARFTPAMLQDLPPAPVDAAAAAQLADRLLPPPHLPVRPSQVLARPSFQALAGVKSVQIDQATGAYFLFGPNGTTLRDASGHLIARQVEWRGLLRQLHRAGWVSGRLGTWPADLAAGAMMVFGLSGLWLFFTPRLRRLKNRLARRRPA